MDMPRNVAALFADPLVRQLTTANPDDLAPGGAIGMALDVLASCAVIGLRKDPAYFPKAMAEWFGIAPDSLSTIPIFPRVAPLASLLRETRTVDHLLEQDLEVYQAVRGAYESG